MPKVHQKFNALQAAVQAARSDAENEARRDCGKGFLRSRGAWFVTLSDKAGMVPPLNENYQDRKRLSAKELDKLIADVEARHPFVDRIDVAGGWDYAERITDFEDGAHDPWVSEWEVTAWMRNAPSL